MGRGIEAVNYINKIQQQTPFTQGSLPWTNLQTARVIVCYEQNKLRQAKQLCETLLPQINHACVTEVISTIYLSLSRLFFIEGNFPKAVRALDQLQRILNFGQYQRFNSQLAQESMRQAWLRGDEKRALKMYSQYSLQASLESLRQLNHQYHEASERYALALHYWYMFKGEYDKSSILLQLLYDALYKQGAISRALVVLANIITLEYCRGNTNLAIMRLAKIIKEEGYMVFSRTLFDEAPGLDQVFMAAQNAGRINIPELFKQVYTDSVSYTHLTLPTIYSV